MRTHGLALRPLKCGAEARPCARVSACTKQGDVRVRICAFHPPHERMRMAAPGSPVRRQPGSRRAGTGGLTNSPGLARLFLCLGTYQRLILCSSPSRGMSQRPSGCLPQLREPLARELSSEANQSFLLIHISVSSAVPHLVSYCAVHRCGWSHLSSRSVYAHHDNIGLGPGLSHPRPPCMSRFSSQCDMAMSVRSIQDTKMR